MTYFACVKSSGEAGGGGGGQWRISCSLGCSCWKESPSNEEGSVVRRRSSKGIGFLQKSTGESYKEEKGRCCFGKCRLSCLHCFHCKKSSGEEESRKRGKCSRLFCRKWKEEDSASVKKQKCWKSCFCCNKSSSSSEEETAKRRGKCGMMGCFFCCKKSPKTEEPSRKRGKWGMACFFCCNKSPNTNEHDRSRDKPDKTSGLGNPLLLRENPHVQHNLQEVSVAGNPPRPVHNKNQGATKIISVSDNPTIRSGPQDRPTGKSDKAFGLDNPPLLRATPQVQHNLQEVSVTGNPPRPTHNKDQEATKISSVSDNPTLRPDPADESSRKRGKYGMGCFFCCCKKSPKAEESSRKRGKCGMGCFFCCKGCFFCCNKSPKTDEQDRPRGKPVKTSGLSNPPLVRANPQVQHNLQEVSVAGNPPGPIHNKDQGATKIMSVSDNPTLRPDPQGQPTGKPEKTSGLGNPTPQVQHNLQEVSVICSPPGPTRNKDQGATKISSILDNPTLRSGPADESSRKKGKCGIGCFFCCCKKSPKTEEPSRKRGKCGMCFLCCKKSPKEEEPSRKRGKCETGCFRCTKSLSEETVRRKGWPSLCCFCCNKSSMEGGEKRGGGEEKGKCCFHCAKSSEGKGCFSCCNKSSEKGEGPGGGGGGEEEKAKGCFHFDNFSSCCKSSKEEESRRRGGQKSTCCCYRKSTTRSGSSPRRRGCAKIVGCNSFFSKSPCKKKVRCSRRLCWKRKEKKQPNHLASLVKSISFKSDSGGRQRSAVEEILRIGNGNIAGRVFTYRQLAAATQNFNPECLLGTGGFGKVYKGQLEDTKEIVAVKQLDRQGYQGNREFLIEVLMLSLLDHKNLVNLLGYCADGDERILVYEFMPLGSLQDHLHDLSPNSKPLDWTTRMKIAAGAARGLEYLHDTANPPVIYRDLKASNILLDKDFTPKLSDFGLAKLGPVGEQMHISTRVMGTYGYCAPEYARTGKLTKMSDVYSFGVLLLEIITGRKPMDKTRPLSEQVLIEWAAPLLNDKKKFVELADPLLEGKFPVKALYQALAIASVCLQENSSTRPVVMDIVTALEFLAGQNSCD